MGGPTWWTCARSGNNKPQMCFHIWGWAGTNLLHSEQGSSMIDLSVRQALIQSCF